LVWLPGGLAAAGEGAGERVGETLHPAIRLLVEVDKPHDGYSYVLRE